MYIYIYACVYVYVCAYDCVYNLLSVHMYIHKSYLSFLSCRVYIYSTIIYYILYSITRSSYCIITVIKYCIQ